VTFQTDSQIPAPRVPLTDERTGFVSREWFRFFNLLYNATGTVSRVRGTGSTNGISLTGDVTTSGFLRLEGTLRVTPESGGTGLNVAPADGQLLIGSDGNYFLNTLQPGPGMLVTNAQPRLRLPPAVRRLLKQLILILRQMNLTSSTTRPARPAWSRCLRPRIG
jgi:hypothetical protein